LKREASILAHSLRAVALVITTVSLVTFVTAGYSAYAEVSNVTSILGGSSPTSAIVAKIIVHASATFIYLNVTLENKGFYPINLTLSCRQPVTDGIACTSPSITVLPGQSQTLHLMITVANYSQLPVESLQVSGQMKVALEPFGSVTLTVNLGTLIARGGA